VELSNSFTVEVGPDRAWEVLTDVPAIAPCLPGAQLQEVDGEEYKGIVKVKVGPIVAQYRGAATFVEKDAEARRIVLRAEGRETRGQGNASATITARLQPAGDRTEVVVDTDLTVTGKVAQFGRGVMADVSAKLMDQFAENLARTVLAEGAATGDTAAPEEQAAGTGTASGTASGTGTAAGTDAERPPVVPQGPEPEPSDLLGTAGVPAAQRIIPPLVAAVVALLLIRFLVRRRRA
jgi:carbon monoxide dehydrogenase subunit G